MVGDVQVLVHAVGHVDDVVAVGVLVVLELLVHDFLGADLDARLQELVEDRELVGVHLGGGGARDGRVVDAGERGARALRGEEVERGLAVGLALLHQRLDGALREVRLDRAGHRLGEHVVGGVEPRGVLEGFEVLAELLGGGVQGQTRDVGGDGGGELVERFDGDAVISGGAVLGDDEDLVGVGHVADEAQLAGAVLGGEVGVAGQVLGDVQIRGAEGERAGPLLLVAREEVDFLDAPRTLR